MVEPDSSAEDDPPEENGSDSQPAPSSEDFGEPRPRGLDDQSSTTGDPAAVPATGDVSGLPSADAELSELSSATSGTGDASRLSNMEAVREQLASTERSAVLPSGPPGPGVIESAAWTGGVIIVHLIAAVGLTILAAVFVAISGQGDLTPEGQPAWFTTFLLTGEMAIFVLVAIIATSVRLRGQPARYMGFSPPPLAHMLILIVLLMPVSVISSKLYELVDVYAWSPLVSRSPLLQMLDGMNTMDTISQITGEMSLFALLMTLAVAPAIGEEVVFRGVIGRGLVARMGVFYGVLLTSVFFAAVHIHPVHAVGVFLLGVTMHMLHLASRSFWAPVIYHYLNNAWATVMSKYGGQPSEAASVEESSRWFPVTLAVLLVMLLLKILWDTRVKYVEKESGEEWTPGYESVERPPPWISYDRIRARADTRMVIVATVTAFLFFDVLFTAPESPEGAPETPTEENAPLEQDPNEPAKPLDDGDSTQVKLGQNTDVHRFMLSRNNPHEAQACRRSVPGAVRNLGATCGLGSELNLDTPATITKHHRPQRRSHFASPLVRPVTIDSMDGAFS